MLLKLDFQRRAAVDPRPDLDPHDADTLGLGQQAPHLPPGQSKFLRDLGLGALKIVVGLGHLHHEMLTRFVRRQPDGSCPRRVRHGPAPERCRSESACMTGVSTSVAWR